MTMEIERIRSTQTRSLALLCVFAMLLLFSERGKQCERARARAAQEKRAALRQSLFLPLSDGNSLEAFMISLSLSLSRLVCTKIHE